MRCRSRASGRRRGPPPARRAARRTGRARARGRGTPRSRRSRRDRRGCAIRERVAADQVPAAQLGRIEAEPLRGDVHRPLEREVELRAAEAAVEPGGAAVRERDAVPGADVPDAVRAGERPVHAVQRRRLGRAEVRADVLDHVVGEREQLPGRREAGADGRRARGRRRAGREVLGPVLDPPDGDAEVLRGEPHEDDVDVDGRLDPEAAARVGRRDQPQPRAGRPRAPAATECSVNGPWKFAHAVSEPAAAFQSATTP